MSTQRATRALADLLPCRAWGAAENKVTSDYSSKYKAFPIPEDPLFTSEDVSVVAVLLSPPNIFERCLKSWLKNQPREVILVTTFDYCEYNPSKPAGTATFCPPFAKVDIASQPVQGVLAALESYDLTTADRAIIKVVHLEEGVSGHRFQQAMGFKEASGKIMAVTDDQILWPDGLLKSSKHLAWQSDPPSVFADAIRMAIPARVPAD